MNKKKDIPTYRIEHLSCQERHAQAKDFDVFRFEYFSQDIERFRHPHRHDFYTLLLTTSGRGSQEIDFETYEIAPYRQFFISPGQIHRWCEIEDIKGYIVFFTRDFFELRYHSNMLAEFPFFNTALREPYIQLDAESAKDILYLTESLEREHNQNEVYKQAVMRSTLNVLLCHLARLYLPQAEADSPALPNQGHWATVRKFEQLINEHFREKHQVKDYAALLFLSPNYLNALCSKTLGVSAGDFIRKRIMLEAKRLLAHTDKTVSEIAAELQFEDNAYFSRFFRKYAQSSPEQFRRLEKKTPQTV